MSDLDRHNRSLLEWMKCRSSDVPPSIEVQCSADAEVGLAPIWLAPDLKWRLHVAGNN